MLTAKLLVAAGAPLQFRLGEILLPVQPKPLNTCSVAMVAPSLSSVLVKVILCAFAALAPDALTPSAAIQTASFVMAVAPPNGCGIACSRPADTSHSNFRDGAEAQDAIGERLRRSSQAFPGGYHERSDPHPPA